MELFKSLAASAAVMALMYLGFAFIAWDLNPGGWTEDMRAMCATCAIVFGGLVFAIAASETVE